MCQFIPAKRRVRSESVRILHGSTIETGGFVVLMCAQALIKAPIKSRKIFFLF